MVTLHIEHAIREYELTLQREGEYWALSAPGRVLRLKDSKGLWYLERLMLSPEREFHVLELAADLPAAAGAALGDAGAWLDADAKRMYRARVAELQEAIAEADVLGDSAGKSRARAELDAIAEQLAHAVGLGGRDRKAASVSERARVNVQKRLRDVIERIEREDRDLAHYLSAALKTGTYCVFSPPRLLASPQSANV